MTCKIDLVPFRFYFALFSAPLLYRCDQGHASAAELKEHLGGTFDSAFDHIHNETQGIAVIDSRSFGLACALQKAYQRCRGDSVVVSDHMRPAHPSENAALSEALPEHYSSFRDFVRAYQKYTKSPLLGACALLLSGRTNGETAHLTAQHVVHADHHPTHFVRPLADSLRRHASTDTKVVAGDLLGVLEMVDV